VEASVWLNVNQEAKEEITHVRGTTILWIKQMSSGEVYICVHCQNIFTRKRA